MAVHRPGARTSLSLDRGCVRVDQEKPLTSSRHPGWLFQMCFPSRSPSGSAPQGMHKIFGLVCVALPRLVIAVVILILRVKAFSFVVQGMHLITRVLGHHDFSAFPEHCS